MQSRKHSQHDPFLLHVSYVLALLVLCLSCVQLVSAIVISQYPYCIMMLLFVHVPGLEDKSKKSKAERIAFDLLEYLDQINYNKYYDSMGSPGTRGGEKEKLFSDFSSQSIKAAQASLHDV